MARIPDSELERLKSDVSVQRLVEASGVELKKGGKDLLGKCPFHEDDEASLVVTLHKNLWHCFGCQIGGGPIDWVIKSRGVSFRHAVEILKADPSLAAGVPQKVTTTRALPPPVALDTDDHALLAQVIDYYHQRLKEDDQAQAYLKARGLEHPALVDTFKLGVADRTLGLRLPLKNRADGAANHRDLPEELTQRNLSGQKWGQENGTGLLSRRHFYAYRRLHPDIWSWTLNTKADAGHAVAGRPGPGGKQSAQHGKRAGDRTRRRADVCVRLRIAPRNCGRIADVPGYWPGNGGRQCNSQLGGKLP